ncbi:chemotaxis protein CheW [Azorhizobium sp. AG788]|uniref:chemotaxis protein CheW n=1 Tax=Azorhizobium sp. AG788 TaxID=2183897 RepID=UPI003138E0F4
MTSTSLVLARQETTGAGAQYVTVRIGPQLFGLPIEMVHEVFVPDHITRVPLSSHEIEGVLNLRGRIMTMVNMRSMLGLPANTEARRMAVGIEHHGESFGLMIDEVGEVLVLDPARRESNPTNLDPHWSDIVTGVYRLKGQLMLVLDVDLALGRLNTARAA